MGQRISLGACLVLGATALAVTGCGLDYDHVTVLPAYQISGTVSGDSVAGITIGLIGDKVVTTKTDASGNYSFTELLKGNYQVIPAQAESIFSPASIAVVLKDANVTGQDFISSAKPTPTYDISGTISGDCVAGVTVSLTGDKTATTTTDMSGTYSFAAVANGGYVVTPTQTYCTFEPTSIAVTVKDAEIVGQNFTSIKPTYSVSGTVTGLKGSYLVLQNDGGNDLAVSAVGDFTFTTKVAGGQPYAVTVLAQPQNPLQNCTVQAGSGTVSANVTGVDVTCSLVAPTMDGPRDQTVALGDSATFSVTASGNGPFSYQWRRGGVPVGGATSASYTVPSVTAADHGSEFSVVVTDRYQISSTSRSAILYLGVHGFIASGNMTTPRTDHLAALLTSGTVLVVGGSNFTTGILRTAELYDPSSGKFTATGGLAGIQSAETLTALPDGRALVTGYAETASYSVPELYDPLSGTFSTAGSMSVPRGNPAAVLLRDGRVLLAGGSVSGGGVYANAELFDPSSGKFSPTTGAMNAGRSGAVAVVLVSGKVLIAGGSDASGAQLKSAELFDPSKGTFTPTGSMTAPQGAPMVLLPSGKVLVAGGWDYTWNSVTNAAELYDPGLGTFAALASGMTADRTGHRMTLLSNGKVLITGGVSGYDPNYEQFYGYNTSAELYDPASATFTLTNSMSVARSGATATLLADGRVLISGGMSGNTSQDYLSSSELFW